MAVAATVADEMALIVHCGNGYRRSPVMRGLQCLVMRNALISFLIVASVLFLIIKGVNRLKAQVSADEQAAPPPPPAEQVLLTEIRVLLKAQRG